MNESIAAVVDLAFEQIPFSASREFSYCRFPLLDGSGNFPWLLKAAILSTAAFLEGEVACLICCEAGMSRSPAIAAAALSLVSGKTPDACLKEVAQAGPIDVAPALWNEICTLLNQGLISSFVTQQSDGSKTKP
jgi:protein-tyrosine phosphatase